MGTNAVAGKTKAKLADQANHLANQLTSDMESLMEIRARWGARGRCQVEDLQELFRTHPIPDPDHALYIALSGIDGRQDSLVTEVKQAVDAAADLVIALRDVVAEVNR